MLKVLQGLRGASHAAFLDCPARIAEDQFWDEHKADIPEGLKDWEPLAKVRSCIPLPRSSRQRSEVTGS